MHTVRSIDIIEPAEDVGRVLVHGMHDKGLTEG